MIYSALIEQPVECSNSKKCKCILSKADNQIANYFSSIIFIKSCCMYR